MYAWLGLEQYGPRRYKCTIRIRYGPCRYDMFSIRSAADTIRNQYGQQLILYVFDTVRSRYDEYSIKYTCTWLKVSKSRNLDFNNKVNVLCWSIHWIQQKLVLTQNDHLCSVYHSVIHKVLAWWPYRYVSIDFCIDNVPRVNVSSQPYILTNITQVASRN